MVPFIPQSHRVQSSAQSSSNQLVIGSTTATDTVDLNPVKMITTYVMAETYAPMIGWDSAGNLVPMLAQNWTVSADGLTVTYNLRPNLEWSDGQPLNSSDVAFTFNLVSSQAPLWYYLFSQIQTANKSTVTQQMVTSGAITTPSATQVVFHLSSVAATFLIYAGGQPIYPEHYYAGQNLTATNPNLSTMVGSGAFIPRSYTPGTELDMIPNPHYLGGAPKLSGVVFKYFTSSTSAEIALEGGSINYLQGLPATDVSSISKTAGIQIGTEEDQSNVYIVYNTHPNLSDNSSNPVSNLLVRKAIAMALDLPSILNASFGGSQYYKLANQIEVPNMYYGGQSVQNTTIPKPEYPYNVTGAAALLDQAGFKADSSGNRFTLSLIFLTGGMGASGSGPTLKMVQLIQSYLSMVGITVTLQSDDATTFNNAAYSAAPPKAWNLALSIISESPDADVAPFYMVSSLGGNAGQGGFNSGGYNDTVLNQMVLQEENTTAGPQRLAVLAKLDGYVHQQLPVLELYYEVQIVAWSNKFQGFELGLGNPWHDYWGSLKMQSLANASLVGSSSSTTSANTSTTTLPPTTSSSSSAVVSTTSSIATSSVAPTTSTSSTPTATTSNSIGSTVVVTTSSSSASGSSSTLLIAGIVVVIIIIAAVAALMMRRGRGGSSTTTTTTTSPPPAST
jgi:peptide/nickel transport system substrate-binding protein